jgi:hypothetical protein
MIQMVFKNLPQSELTQAIVLRRIVGLLSKFPSLENSRVLVTLEMENSPTQAGVDHFSVKLQILSGPLRGLRISKSSDTLHSALAEVMEDGFETFSRYYHKKRDQKRQRARRHAERLKETGS